jgi:gluconokinase
VEIIGLDIGTSSVKLVKCSLEGKINQTREKTIINSNPYGFFKELTDFVDFSDGDCIVLSCHFPSLIALDTCGDPLTEVMPWFDNCAASLVHDFKKDEDKCNELYQKTGCVMHESYSLWKLLWLKKNEPQIFKKAKRFVSLPEYMNYQLTGRFTISHELASATGMYNMHEQNWDESILDMLEISSHKLSLCLPMTHSEKVLGQDVQVVLGAGDGFLAHLGSGCSKGIMSSTIGTSGALRVSVDKPVLTDPNLWCYLFEDKYLLGSAVNGGCNSLIWFKDLIGDFEIDPEIGGPFFLPFLHGERGPNYSQNRTASLIGLTCQDNLETIARSIMEGVLFNLYSCYSQICESAGVPSEIRASGGYINSDAMLQMQANIFDKEILVPEVEQASAFGACMVGLKSLGVESRNVGIEKSFSPDLEKHDEYMERYSVFKEL